MITYTMGQMATALSVSVTGLRQWATEFGQYLSDRATPEKGKPRLFTEDDTLILQTVAVMRQQSHPYTEIHKALTRGDRFEFKKQEPLDMGGDDGEETGLTIGRLTGELAHTSGQLTAVSKERDRLLASLDTERAARLEAEKVAATAPMLEEERDRLRLELDRARLPFWKRWGKE